MEQLRHFSHDHPLSLVQFQPQHDIENSDKEDEDEDEVKDDVVVEEGHASNCNMCEEAIYSFHLCYYSCKDCDYFLHKFCAQLPKTQQNHPLNPGHNLRLIMSRSSFGSSLFRCAICQVNRKGMHFYICSTCSFTMDIICASMSEQKMDHPSHPHQLQRYFGRAISSCNACGDEHSGTFYYCTTCYSFRIHLNCALLPVKLLIQQYTNESFNHSHLLTLAYSFLFKEKRDKFFPVCRVCEEGFDPNLRLYTSSLWHYRCDKCRYYVHVDCATSRKEPFLSSILMPAGFGKTYKNFKDDDYPSLLRCPFPDESVNLLMHRLINKVKLVIKRKLDGGMFCHPHPLILVDTLLNNSVSLHDPMRRVELQCDGCVRPIMSVPFYKCSKHHCDFVLHEWCTRLPSKIQDHHGHPEHTLVFLAEVPGRLLGLFWCNICQTPCNGFAYGCKQCEYYVDVNCGFVPNVITHEAHPNHLLLRFKATSQGSCKACKLSFRDQVGFLCPTCDFYLHTECALLLPRTIRHKYDKHPLSLRYYPAENHSSKYFCEICEDELNPTNWFYHCSTCASSMHSACAPLKLQCERSTYLWYSWSIFMYINVKFGRTLEIGNHSHPVTSVQGIDADGKCVVCDKELHYQMIFKCLQCKISIHYRCALPDVNSKWVVLF